MAKPLLLYVLSRVIQFAITLLLAVTIVFVVNKMMPVDFVESIINRMLAVGEISDPQALNQMRETLHEVFGLTYKSPFEEYVIFLRRVFTFDFGFSLINYPTPAFTLVLMRLPWTLGLLSVTTLTIWILGNTLGAIAGYYRSRRFAKILESMAISLYPIPYYILAIILVLLFAYTIPMFPVGGGTSIISETLNLETIVNIIWHATLPALSIILPGALGWSFLSARTLTLVIMSEDYYRYAKIRGLPEDRILRKYVFRNILAPQTTVLTLSLGGIFTGAILTEVIFNYPGVGTLLLRAVANGDLNLVMAILIFSIITISLGTLLIDFIYPLIDPRIRYK